MGSFKPKPGETFLPKRMERAMSAVKARKLAAEVAEQLQDEDKEKAELAVKAQKLAKDVVQEEEFEGILEEKVVEAQEKERKYAKKPAHEKTKRAEEELERAEKLKKMRQELGISKMTPEEKLEAEWDETLKEAEKELGVGTGETIKIPEELLSPKKLAAMDGKESAKTAEKIEQKVHKTLNQEIDDLQQRGIINFSSEDYFAAQNKIQGLEYALAIVADDLNAVGYNVNKGRIGRWFQKFGVKKENKEKFKMLQETRELLMKEYDTLNPVYDKMTAEIYKVLDHGNVFFVAARGLGGGKLKGAGIGLKQ